MLEPSSLQTCRHDSDGLSHELPRHASEALFMSRHITHSVSMARLLYNKHTLFNLPHCSVYHARSPPRAPECTRLHA